jgi:hypothetical protein
MLERGSDADGSETGSESSGLNPVGRDEQGIERGPRPNPVRDRRAQRLDLDRPEPVVSGGGEDR